jgi:hypothetical protein
MTKIANIDVIGAPIGFVDFYHRFPRMIRQIQGNLGKDLACSVSHQYRIKKPFASY